MEITKTEFDKLYGYVELVFDSYYKYSFTFKGKTNSQDTVIVVIGGCADDIYRESITAGEKVKVSDIEGRYAAVYEGDNSSEPFHSYSDY